MTLVSRLAKKLNPKHITLVSNRDYFVFSPTLHEVSTLDEELAGFEKVRQGIALNYDTLKTTLGINVIISPVQKIDLGLKQAYLENQTIDFSYGFLALGSKNNFYDIPDASLYALPLKNLTDAFKIRSQIEFAIQSESSNVQKKLIRIIIAGGGYTGVELAGEMVGFLDFLCWKNHFPKDKVELVILEAGHYLLSGMGAEVSRDVTFRLSQLGVKVSIDSKISEVSSGMLSLADGEKLAFNVLIWAMGIKPESLPIFPEVPMDSSGKILVNSYLQLRSHHFFYVLGDMANITSADGKSSPPTARDAIHQAKYVALAFSTHQKKRPLKPYVVPSTASLVSAGGKWTILKYGRLYFKGKLFYLLKNIVHLAFYVPIIGLLPAIRLVYFQHKTYILND